MGNLHSSRTSSPRSHLASTCATKPGGCTDLAAEVSQYYDVDEKQPPFEAVIDSATGVGKTYILAGRHGILRCGLRRARLRDRHSGPHHPGEDYVTTSRPGTQRACLGR